MSSLQINGPDSLVFNSSGWDGTGLPYVPLYLNITISIRSCKSQVKIEALDIMALPRAKDVRGESQQRWDTCFCGLPTLPTCPPFPER